jgi:hypothetical protein
MWRSIGSRVQVVPGHTILREWELHDAMRRRSQGSLRYVQIMRSVTVPRGMCCKQPRDMQVCVCMYVCVCVFMYVVCALVNHIVRLF